MVRDFTMEAKALFARFAAKHELDYKVLEAPIEVLWEFPTQAKLRHRIVLGLQNNDELNFGVGPFWSYLFPYSDKHSEFENLINKWVEGEARIVPRPGLIFQTIELQLWCDGGWTNAYSAGSLTWRKPSTAILTNVAVS